MNREDSNTRTRIFLNYEIEFDLKRGLESKQDKLKFNVFMYIIKYSMKYSMFMMGKNSHIFTHKFKYISTYINFK